MVRMYQLLSAKNDEITLKAHAYLKQNIVLILILAASAFAAYGFQLFNFTMAIDGEIIAAGGRIDNWWLALGRWGLFLLSRLLFPFVQIPFVPLFVALSFQIAAILLILDSFNIQRRLDKIIIGVLCISYPGMAFIYSFASDNYGVGIAMFLVALSLHVYVKGKRPTRWWAVVPGSLAIGTYEPFLPVLFSLFLLYVIHDLRDRGESGAGQLEAHEARHALGVLAQACGITLAAGLCSFLVGRLLLLVSAIPFQDYLGNFFDAPYFFANPFGVVKALLQQMLDVYAGSHVVYGLDIRVIAILLLVLGAGIVASVVRAKRRFPLMVLSLVLLCVFLSVPFLGGMLTRGAIPLRALVGMPIVLAGWALLGLDSNSGLYRSLVGLLTFLCLFQFISSSNYLLASSYAALESDRLLGSQLIMSIDQAQAEAGTSKLAYLEVVGYLVRPPSLLNPRIDAVGASFFEWDEGNAVRIADFLQTLGYYQLQPLPLQRRASLVDLAESMPNWPSPGSVQVVDEVVVVRFGPYSNHQLSEICQSPGMQHKAIGQASCP